MRRTLLGCSLVVLVLLGAAAPAPVAGAGESPDDMFLPTAVEVTPAAPEQGDDVSVEVSVSDAECSPIAIQLSVALDDGDIIIGEVIDSVTVEPDPDGRAMAAFELPDALPGWYGTQAFCSDASTTLVVGERDFEVATLPEFDMAISPQSAVAGTAGTLTVIGQACPFPIVQAHILDADIGLLGFGGQVTVDVRPGGTWRAELPWTADMPADTYAVRARCGDSEGTGRHVYYESVEFVLTAPAQPPAPPQSDPPAFTG
jgi:hypothetical protein